ncbi:sensor histidine kinase [Protaetiibacter intestinalis]|uniref:histidine kinase n=1 Tax=Protaetiibacter intestinalis TaxID=2419774 RepID=A0A387B990_9MICO|nr:HAMP domain-containing sensor histidine kinase [Protaetiibacter intestinalis]AYF98411.1 sensor histidine kinase [Protaetiibacter intestinalis]
MAIADEPTPPPRRRLTGGAVLVVAAAIAGLALIAAVVAIGLERTGWAIGAVVASAIAGGVAAWSAVAEWSRLRADAARVRSIASQSTERVTILSHEIRTPLSLIKGASDLLIEQSPGPLNEQQLRFATTISANSDHLVQLAEDLLTQARIDAGMFSLHLSRTDLRALSRRTVEELRRLHTIAIDLDVPGAPPRLWVDAGLIRQAITNLVNNAVKASPDASTILVRVAHGLDGGATISVSDNGTGMNELERRRLFERFASGHPLRDGTGLGLVITRQIARLHGGDLYVDTVAGRGTTIILAIPAMNETVEDDDAPGTAATPGARRRR